METFPATLSDTELGEVRRKSRIGQVAQRQESVLVTRQFGGKVIPSHVPAKRSSWGKRDNPFVCGV